MLVLQAFVFDVRHCAVNVIDFDDDEDDEMKYDDIYAYIGQVGTYQCCVLVAIALFQMFLVDSVTFIFVGALMPHWCRVPDLAAVSFGRQRYIAIPPGDPAAGDGETEAYSQCEMYAFNYSAFSKAELRAWNRTRMVDNSTEIVRCNDWVYDQTTFVRTVVSRVLVIISFNCDSKHYIYSKEMIIYLK